MVARGELSAPIVIGRDHLDAGSVASPNRETEGMKDGSDAIADWPILNALVNTACGAGRVSVHHGGGVGTGYSLHAGMVVVADGSADAARRLELVLASDPGMGVLRHVDAGYDEARTCALEREVKVLGSWNRRRLRARRKPTWCSLMSANLWDHAPSFARLAPRQPGTSWYSRVGHWL